MDKCDLLDDLDKWQACSRSKLADMEPASLFESAFAQRYGRLHTDYWHRLCHIHGSLFSLEQLSDFPFDLIYGPGQWEFWRYVIVNFSDAIVLKLHGLLSDTGDDVHTLRSLRNEIVKGPWLLKDHRDLFMRTLVECKFDKEVESIAESVKQIRPHIAHTLVDRATGDVKRPQVEITFREVMKLFDAVHALFGALSFGRVYLTLVGDLTPSTVGGCPTRTCLDMVLDAVLRGSNFVNMSELRRDYWPMERAHLDKDTLNLLNKLRKRVELPEV
jgi:hypothetical protein